MCSFTICRVWRPLLLPVLGLALVSARPEEGSAFGLEAHVMIMRIAEEQLGAEASDQVQAELGRCQDLLEEKLSTAGAQRSLKSLEETTALSALDKAGIWSDFVKRSRGEPQSSSWHYVNVPVQLTLKREELTYFDDGENILSRLTAFRKVLRSSHNEEERRRAFLHVCHLVGDLHMPLHVGDIYDESGRGSRGGNDIQVRFTYPSNGELKEIGTNLHSLWDTKFLLAQSSSFDERLLGIKKLVTPKSVTGWTAGEPDLWITSWAFESYTLSRKIYLEHGTNTARGTSLGPEYCKTFLPLWQERVAQAGVRLAALLREDLAFHKSLTLPE